MEGCAGRSGPWSLEHICIISLFVCGRGSQGSKFKQMFIRTRHGPLCMGARHLHKIAHFAALVSNHFELKLLWQFAWKHCSLVASVIYQATRMLNLATRIIREHNEVKRSEVVKYEKTGSFDFFAFDCRTCLHL